MGRKLSIVVTCTDGKTSTPKPSLRVGNLTARHPAGRRRQWLSRVEREAPFVSLRELYRGQLWTSSLRLESVARSVGYDAKLYVASAGLGLRRVDSLGVPYAATFTPGHSDSVCSDAAEGREWWKALHELPGSLGLAQLTGPRLMIVASEVYASVLQDELVDIVGGDVFRQVLIFGGSTEIEGVARIPANRNLRSRLGGSTTSINARAAAEWLRRDREGRFWDESLERAWRRWSAAVEVSETYDRVRLEDEEVQLFIADLLRRGGPMSRTSALRALRTAGLACEQARFRALYEAVVG